MSDTVISPTFSAQQTKGLQAIFFLSGAAGLIFEVLWFRLTALSIGSSIWAATVVLSAFIAGLAAGNGLAIRMASRITHPLRLYAGLEITVALTGMLLMFILPTFGTWLAPFSLELLESGGGWQLQGMRLLIAFLLMLIPTTAMGLTLPLLVRALQAQGQSGRIIGQLYGWNTLGAVSGLLLSEWILIRYFGMTGSAVAATAACLVAASAALKMNRPIEKVSAGFFRPRWRLALAAALAGAIVLGLEVIWFRLLLLHLRGTDSSFTYLLVMVLTGLAIGSLLASAWLSRRRCSTSTVVSIVLLAALAVPSGYLALSLPVNIWIRAALMITPTAMLSGALLPMLAATLTDQNQQPAESTGWIWLANTSGGAFGAALAGLYLLPSLGMEISLLTLGSGYIAVALCLFPENRAWQTLAACLLISGSYLLIPKGWTDSHIQAASAVYRQLDNSAVIQTREGLNETVQLLERRKYGQTYSYRLVTDGYSMSGTERDSQRYMKMFAWLPQSLHPDTASALLISYGVGTTASALLADDRLKRLSIVDLSPDVLAMSPFIHGAQHDPLLDDRTTVIVEDGRQYLLITDRRFDLITAEPPPPRMKGVVNLYTREYFQLIHDRLNPGGYSSYWLPVDQMTVASSHAVIAAYCAVFTDCSLWSGSNYNWILLGSRQAGMASTSRLHHLWNTSQSVELATLGLEKPGMLGAAFLGDATQLAQWIKDSRVLSDYWPKRLDEHTASQEDIQAYARWADNMQARMRFSTSQWVQEFLPATFRAEALDYFDLQPLLNNEVPADSVKNLPLVHRLLSSTDLRTPVYWLLGSDIYEQRLIDRALENGYQAVFAYPLGIRALTEHNYQAAASLFTEALKAGDSRAHGPAVYSLCRNGQSGLAQTLAADLPDSLTFQCWTTD